MSDLGEMTLKIIKLELEVDSLKNQLKNEVNINKEKTVQILELLQELDTRGDK